jgi:hypothetical protein
MRQISCLVHRQDGDGSVMPDRETTAKTLRGLVKSLPTITDPEALALAEAEIDRLIAVLESEEPESVPISKSRP